MTKGKKPVEIELKLVLTGQEAESAIVAKMREHNYMVKELDKVRNIDIYLDTFRLAAHEEHACVAIPHHKRCLDVYNQEHRDDRRRDREKNGNGSSPQGAGR